MSYDQRLRNSTIVLGMLVFDDPATPGRVIPLALIVTGVISPRLFGA